MDRLANLRLSLTAGSAATQPSLSGGQVAPSGLAPVLDAVFAAGGAHGPQLVVQVGCGRQVALDWGMRLRQRGGGLLLCVDYFLVSWAERVAGLLGPPTTGGTTSGGAATGQQAGSDLLSAPLRQLLAAVQEAGLRQWVLPLPGHPRDVLRALTAAGAAPDIVSLGGLDGAGAGAGREALERWLALLPAGGMLALAHVNASTAADVGAFAAAAGASVLTLASHSLVLKGGAAAGVAGVAAQQQPGLPEGAAAAGAAGVVPVVPVGPVDPRTCDPAAAVPAPGWAPCDMRFIRVDMAGRVVTASFVSQGPWGNLLSPYFQGLAVAQLLGFRFMYMSGFAEDAWLRHLPREVAPGLICPNASEVARACVRCPDPTMWEFAHGCDAGWTQARRAMQNVTLGALRSWAAAAGRALPGFLPGDAAIQVRCSQDTLLGHGYYGPSAFSMYTTYLPPDTKRVFAIYAHHGHNGPAVYAPCDKLVDAMGRYITQRRPGVSFAIIGGEKWEDFSRLALAPVAFRDSMSSFGLWATLANTGRVFAPPALAPIKDSYKSLIYTLPTVDDTFRFVNVSVFYPEVASRLNFTIELKDQSPQIDRIIAWLESN
ncbi:hypothetical protein HXX76_015791 [Chlamydomonas incerta]|uniref:Uncharacterized protein n=1 Tax=Chlamydomonas incerta TaxID=51695 RepID=A0A835VRH7_CHLIN|nr:hypothetical protein HXX76_015791 [Chlamydomonas incerta]|eukprot:KAG2422771.1 hypothetical protein HXX76_015791 [Chlamydomonas incerta]